MSAVDEIINYQRSADEDFYGLLNCTEQATVSFPFNFVDYLKFPLVFNILFFAFERRKKKTLQNWI